MTSPTSLYDQIILLGDSITEFSENQERGFGYAPALRDDYVRRLEVVNRGFSGYNTEMVLEFLDEIIPSTSATKVQLITLFLGANDSCFPMRENNQCVPLAVFKKNLIKIVQNPKIVAHSPHIVLITPPPLDERRQFEIDVIKAYPRRRTAENTKLYADAVRDVGNELGLPVLDVWSKFMEMAGWKPGQPLEGSEECPPNGMLLKLLSDGLHLTGDGYKVLYQDLSALINLSFPDMRPENLPFKLPTWDQLANRPKGI